MDVLADYVSGDRALLVFLSLGFGQLEIPVHHNLYYLGGVEEPACGAIRTIRRIRRR